MLPYLSERNAEELWHEDVIKWKHFPRYWSFAWGIHRSWVNSPQRPVTRSFDAFFDLRLNKRLSYDREAGDLRRHCAHYDVTVTDTSMRLELWAHLNTRNATKLCAYFLWENWRWGLTSIYIYKQVLNDRLYQCRLSNIVYTLHSCSRILTFNKGIKQQRVAQRVLIKALVFFFVCVCHNVTCTPWSWLITHLSTAGSCAVYVKGMMYAC